MSEASEGSEADADGPPSAGPRILHRESHFVIVSKPARQAVHRGEWAKRGERFVLQDLRQRLGQPVWPVHRLDRATSGPLLFALARERVAPLAAALAREDTDKRYLALVRGEPAERFVSDRPLTAENGERRPCLTEFCVLERFERAALIEARLRTGRRHQIRRHLAHLAHHVAGDTTYGKGWFNRWLREEHGLPRRLFLHASQLRFRHPWREDEWVEAKDPLPERLKRVLTGLDRI